MRRDFELGPDDVQALQASGHPWETIRSGSARYVLIHNYPVPPGFNHSEARVAIRIDTYPPGPLDMAYFWPLLARADGKPINALTTVTIDGETYQQWSRHYTWRSGIDTLGSHLRRVRAWLTHELRKR